MLLLCLAGAAGWPLARRVAAPGATPVLAAVFGLTWLVTFAALPIPFSRGTVGGLLVIATLANLVLPRPAFALPRLNRGVWLGLGLLTIAFAWSATRPDAYMHYDYFHANMRSLDLARSGSVLSAWHTGPFTLSFVADSTTINPAWLCRILSCST